MKTMPCPTEWMEYIEGEVTQSRARDIESHLSICPVCRRQVEDRRELVDLLGRPDERLAGIDLVPGLRRAIEAPDAEPGRRRRKVPVLAWAAVAIVAFVLAAFLWRLGAPFSSPGQDNGFRVKAARPGQLESDRWVALLPYRLPAGGAPTRLGESISTAEYTLFAYTNLGERPYRYLMVFGVDAQGEVFWFHPPYVEAGTDPESIEIKQGVAGVELSEKIQHDFAPGTLRIVGLFTHEPLKVSQVEAMVQKLVKDGAWRESKRLPVADSGQHIITTEVRP